MKYPHILTQLPWGVLCLALATSGWAMANTAPSLEVLVWLLAAVAAALLAIRLAQRTLLYSGRKIYLWAAAGVLALAAFLIGQLSLWSGVVLTALAVLIAGRDYRESGPLMSALTEAFSLTTVFLIGAFVGGETPAFGVFCAAAVVFALFLLMSDTDLAPPLQTALLMGVGLAATRFGLSSALFVLGLVLVIFLARTRRKAALRRLRWPLGVASAAAIALWAHPLIALGLALIALALWLSSPRLEAQIPL